MCVCVFFSSKGQPQLLPLIAKNGLEASSVSFFVVEREPANLKCEAH